MTSETSAGTGRVKFRLSMRNPFTLDAVSAYVPCLNALPFEILHRTRQFVEPGLRRPGDAAEGSRSTIDEPDLLS